jgi:uncharacterized membrane protein
MTPGTTRGTVWLNDLVFVAAVALGAPIVLLVLDAPRPFEWILGLLLLLLVPGYALLAALLPEVPGSRRTAGLTSVSEDATPDWVVRLALSLPVTVVIVAVVGGVLSLTVGIRLRPAVVAIGAISLLAAIVAAIRRLGLPAKTRRRSGGGASIASTLAGDTRFQTATRVVAVLALLSTVAFVGAAPPQGEPFTEVSLLTPSGDGNEVLGAYPTTVGESEDVPLRLAIENHEHRAISYDVVTLAQRVGSNGSVLDQRRVDRLELQVASGNRAVADPDVTPGIVGERVRVRFLVYKGDVPATPGTANADLTTHIWLDTTS